MGISFFCIYSGNNCDILCWKTISIIQTLEIKSLLPNITIYVRYSIFAKIDWYINFWLLIITKLANKTPNRQTTKLLKTFKNPPMEEYKQRPSAIAASRSPTKLAKVISHVFDMLRVASKYGGVVYGGFVQLNKIP